MLSLYIVRHGQTTYNVEGKVQGWCDSPLTEIGIQQAKTISEGLKEINFVSCICSDKKRAVDTAKYILNQRKIPITTNEKFRELHFGSFEERPVNEIQSLNDNILKTGFKEFGGENIDELVKRYLEGFSEIKQTVQDGNVLLVSHGRAIMTALKAIDPSIDEEEVIVGKSKIVNNCSVSRLDYINDHWEIIDFNHTF